MKLFIGADHRGYHLKEAIETYLRKRGLDVVDEGDEKLDHEDDFTVYAARVVNAMRQHGDEARGILVCGSGQGMAIAANRHKNIRAVLGWSKKAAIDSRNDEDSNVLALPADIFDGEDAVWQSIIDAWLATPFADAVRYRRRIQQLDEL